MNPSVDRRDYLRAAAAAGATLTLPSIAAADQSVTARDHRIESFDGTEIAATVYLPEGNGRHPVVMATHGWGGDRSGLDGWARTFAAEDYVVLTWDQRGFGESDGEVGLSGPKEVHDVSALLDWVADHDRTRRDPAVGMIGASYGGGIQLNAAAVEDRIDALVPIVPWWDLTFSLAPDGSLPLSSGVPKLGWTSLLYAAGVAGARGLTSGDGQPDRGDLQRGVSPRLHEIYAKTLARNDIPREGRSFLKVRSPATKLDDIDAPAMVVQGWPDTLFVPNEGQRIVDGLRAGGTEARLVFFDGGHTMTETAEPQRQVRYLFERVFRWFEEHLRGGPDAAIPPVTYWDDDRDAFRTATEWPPSQARERELDLADPAGEGTTVVANTVAPTSTSQLSPRNSDLLPVSAVQFDFPVTRAVDVATTPTLSLAVEPIGRVADLFLKVYRVRGGSATLVNNQVMPVEVEGLGKRTVEAELVSFQRHFRPGDALRLVVATTDAAFASARQSAGARIHHDAGESVLSVHARGPANAFGTDG